MRLGIKAHWRDVAQIVALGERWGCRAIEYQMLAGDVERDAEQARAALAPFTPRFELRVHQPERMDVGGARVLVDPASEDARIRAASVATLSRALALAADLGASGFVLHPGGVHAPGERGGAPGRLRESLRALPRGVPLLMENMPHHYGAHDRSATWAQRGEDLLALADEVDGFTLDTSHAYLVRPEGDLGNVRDLARILGPRVRHVHACGSRANRAHAGEGTPFADSDYGPELVAEVVRRAHPDVVVVPETMGGHLDGGRLYAEDLALLAPALSRA